MMGDRWPSRSLRRSGNRKGESESSVECSVHYKLNFITELN